MDRERWANVGRLRRDYQRNKDVLAGSPLELFVEVSARCNLRCRMCAIGHDERYQPGGGRPGLLTPELFGTLGPLFPTLLRAHLYGLGEPLLNPHLEDFVRELSAAGVHTRTTSNATLMTRERAEALVDAGLDRISLSIDGATAGTYEEIRRGGRFSDVLRGLDALGAVRRQTGRPELTVNFVAMASNLPDLPRLIELCTEAGVDEVNVEPLFDWGRSAAELGRVYGDQNLARLSRDGTPETLLARARDRARAAGIRFSSRFFTDTGSWDYAQRVAEGEQTGWVCSEPFSTLFVTTAGEVRTCCLNDTCFGHLNGHGDGRSIHDIWNGSELRAFRRHHVAFSGADGEPAAGGQPPAGCANCLANGRRRHSPYFEAVEPVSYRPFASVTPEPAPRSGFHLDSPREGETVTDPLVVTGRVPWWVVLPGVDTSKVLESHRPAHRPDPGGHPGLGGEEGAPVRAGGAGPLPLEGAHVLSLRTNGEQPAPGWCRRTVHFHRPAQATVTSFDR